MDIPTSPLSSWLSDRRTAGAAFTDTHRLAACSLRLGAAVLVGTLLLSACGRDAETTSAPASAGAPATTSAAPNAAPVPETAPAGSAAGTPTATPSSPAAGASATTGVADGAATAGLEAWLGEWTGPEGTSLELARELASAGTYRVSVRNLDGTERFRGVAMPGDPTAPADSPLRGPHLTFERAGRLEHLVAGNGVDTGMKWLAGKRNCLVVRQGEGYCRD